MRKEDLERLERIEERLLCLERHVSRIHPSVYSKPLTPLEDETQEEYRLRMKEISAKLFGKENIDWW